jgi:hypothetical protein
MGIVEAKDAHFPRSAYPFQQVIDIHLADSGVVQHPALVLSTLTTVVGMVKTFHSALEGRVDLLPQLATVGLPFLSRLSKSQRLLPASLEPIQTRQGI